MDNPSIHARPHVLVYIYNEPNFNKDAALSWVKSLGIPYYKVTAFSISKEVVFISFTGEKENIEQFITAANLTYSKTAYKEFLSEID